MDKKKGEKQNERERENTTEGRGKIKEKRKKRKEEKGEKIAGQRASTANSTASTPPQVTSRCLVSFSFCLVAICIFMQNMN
jgi:hypothetical protein